MVTSSRGVLFLGLLLGASVVFGCGGDDTTSGTDASNDAVYLDLGKLDTSTGDQDSGKEVVTTDDGRLDDGSTQDVTPDTFKDGASDTDTYDPNCPGSFGCECESNADCYFGLCVETNDVSVCSKSCGLGGECPQGWDCVQVNSGGEAIWGCVYQFPNLCRPCVEDQDCVPSIGAGDKTYVCIEHGPQGRFCGVECERSLDCPDGYVCEDVQFDDGLVKQCRPEDQVCPCTDKFERLKFKTVCYNENGSGKCEGERTCDTDCSAEIPANESCNLLDDDCDGFTDEEIAYIECDLENAYGVCKGKAYCTNGKQDQCQGQYPTAEVCNGQDEDCDGSIDEGFTNIDGDAFADCVDPDIDNDGLENPSDNCIEVKNADQANNDLAEETVGNIKGDACDDDDDNDGIPDVSDNCSKVKNNGQGNADADQFGDVCDCDADADGIANNASLDMLGGACPAPLVPDNCPLVKNLDQKNVDLDAFGDACDCDIDSDAVFNNNPGCQAVDDPDNCPFVMNPEQEDFNNDGVGDACACDMDGDGVINENPGCSASVYDNCADVPNEDQADMNENGVGDACDCDIDSDTVANNNPGCPVVDPADNCPTVYNPNQAATTGEVRGDACNPDWDRDEVLNDDDNCPWEANEDQDDTDFDGIGDKCDCDIDDDELFNAGRDFDRVDCPTPDPADNCAYVYNPGQNNLNGDSEGDACDCDIDGDGDPQPNFGCETPFDPDCAPTNPEVSHYADEFCTTMGVDDDCDGRTDEEGALGCQSYHYDIDRDGYGTDQVACLCEPDGFYDAVVAGDCSPNNIDINPGKQEVCFNGVDDNCNSNQNDLNASGCQDYYKDYDTDNYGSTDFRCYCYPEGDYRTRNTGDCDDTDPEVNPGEDEKCFDGVDNDCNGSQNDEGADDCFDFFYDQDGDGYPLMAYRCLCYEDSPYDLVVDAAHPLKGIDCNDTIPEINPGQGEICSNGFDDDCDGTTDESVGCIGCITYYYDGDGDKYGKTDVSQCLAGPTGKYSTVVPGDCNDANWKVNPGADEECNNLDDNCNGFTDENPSILCDGLPYASATCLNGSCIISQCQAGYFDVNSVSTDGCECLQDANDNTGNSCETAIGLGSLADTAKSKEVVGRIVDEDDEDWYVIQAVDNVDAGNLSSPGKDNFHFRIKMTAPTDQSLRVEIRRGECAGAGAAACTDYAWYTDFYDAGGQKGENPCVTTPGSRLWSCCAPGACSDGAGSAEVACCNDVAQCTDATHNIRHCADDSEYYYIRVYRASGHPTNCLQNDYALEISNGLY